MKEQEQLIADEKELVSCPICGGVKGYQLSEGSTYRWWNITCANCGVDIDECASDRRMIMGGKLPDRWADADDVWNANGSYANSLNKEIARLNDGWMKANEDCLVKSTEIARLESQVEGLHDKIHCLAGEDKIQIKTCCCNWDAQEVCVHHSPMLMKANAEIARLNSFIEKAFQAHSNLDLDIEALAQGEQNE